MSSLQCQNICFTNSSSEILLLLRRQLWLSAISFQEDMASLGDIGLAAAINILSAIGFLLAFAVLRLQPINDRVYFPKWYLKGVRSSPTHSGNLIKKFVNLDCGTYLRFLNWMPAALKMPEPELISHAGLDSAVYIRIYLLGWVYWYWISLFLHGDIITVSLQLKTKIAQWIALTPFHLLWHSLCLEALFLVSHPLWPSVCIRQCSSFYNSCLHSFDFSHIYIAYLASKSGFIILALLSFKVHSGHLF